MTNGQSTRRAAQEPDLIDILQRDIERLRPAERKVAALVLRGPDAAMRSTTSILAQQAGVSEPTVIRFCRSTGCDGLQSFKLRLAQDLAVRSRYLPEDVDGDDGAAAIANKVLGRGIAILSQVRERLDGAQLDAAVTVLARASRLEFYGFGASGLVAVDAQNKFFRLGVPSVAHTDHRVQAMAAAVLGPDAAIVAISHTGRTRELLRSVDIAVANGVPVVALTSSGSPLARRATVTVAVDVPEDTTALTPMASRLAHLAVLDAIQVAVALRRGDSALNALAKGKTTLQDRS